MVLNDTPEGRNAARVIRKNVGNNFRGIGVTTTEANGMSDKPTVEKIKGQGGVVITTTPKKIK